MARENCVTIPGYGRATRLAPRWYVGYLTFQGGATFQRTGSMVGGGFVPPRGFDATFQPVMMPYNTRTASLAGAASVAANPPSLLSLLEPPRRLVGGNV